MFSLAVSLQMPSAYAISEYGPSCAVNEDCIACKEKEKCLNCMHKCFNRFGEPDNKPADLVTKGAECLKRISKWCHAQCWATDDPPESGNVSSIPECEPDFSALTHNK